MAGFRQRMGDSLAGLFVLVAAALLVVTSVLVLRERRTFERRVPFRTLFKESYGIAPGNPVTISGIEVGRVERVVLDDHARVEVGFSVLESHAARVRRNSVAQVKSAPGLGGIIGGTGIKLTMGDPALPEVLPGGYIKGEDPFSFEDALALVQRGRAVERSGDALQNIENLLRSLGAPDGPVQSLLRDAAALVHEVRTGEGEASGVGIGRILGDVRLVLANLNSGLTGVNRLVTTAEGAVGGVREATALAPGVVQKVDGLLDQVAVALAELTRAITDLQKLTASAGGVADDVPRLVGEVDAQLKTLDDLMGALRQNVLIRANLPEPAPPRPIDPGLADTGAAR